MGRFTRAFATYATTMPIWSGNVIRVFHGVSLVITWMSCFLKKASMWRALVGTEATCVLVLGATLQLMHSPPHRALVVIGYLDLFAAGDQAAQIKEFGPLGLEGVESHVIENMKRKGQSVAGEKFFPEGRTWLLAEFGGETQEEARYRAREAQHKIVLDKS